MSRQPALFVSHGAPTLAVRASPARRYLQALGRRLERPRAILAISAHWETAAPAVSLSEAPETIHDFGGFERQLYEIRYPAPGTPDLAREVADRLAGAGHSASARERGLDHGAWVPLLLMFPEADIPVAQLSVQPDRGPAYHRALGRILAPLRDQGVLLLASGSLTHDVRSALSRDHDASTPDWVSAFADWMHRRIADDDLDALLDYRRRAPHAVENHPTEEHLLPLFTALGARLDDEHPATLHRSHTYGVLAMDVIGVGPVPSGINASDHADTLAGTGLAG